ncbi:MAG: hypothetical protein M1833_002857 [Piccolia ochrophora]|nr:MAG: hypothetical protein M1833_002857 [Piccolia ochrophora]
MDTPFQSDPVTGQRDMEAVTAPAESKPAADTQSEGKLKRSSTLSRLSSFRGQIQRKLSRRTHINSVTTFDKEQCNHSVYDEPQLDTRNAIGVAVTKDECFGDLHSVPVPEPCYAVAAPPAPVLEPLLLPSISTTGRGRDWRLSSGQSQRRASSQLSKIATHEHTPHVVDEIIHSENIHPNRRTANPTSESTASCALEIAAAEKRFPPPKPAAKVPRKSNFTEHLDDKIPPAPSTRQTNPTEALIQSFPSLDGHDERYLQRTRASYGYTFSSEEESASSEDASVAWERALKNFAHEHPAIGTRPKTPFSRSVSRKSKMWMKREKSISPKESARNTSHNGMTNDVQHTAREEGVEAPCEDLVTNAKGSRIPSFVHQTPPWKASDKPGKPRRSYSSWYRFPTHSKHERTSSASTQDRVIVIDFAGGKTRSQQKNHSGNSSGVTLPWKLGKKQKGGKQDRKDEKRLSQKPPFAKRMLQGMGRLVRSGSTDYRLPESGHRSSIATGGTLEYPELEVIPAALPTHRTNYGTIPILLDSDQESDKESRSSSSEFLPTEMIVHSPPRDAQIRDAREWAEYYQDCVTLPWDDMDRTSTATDTPSAPANELEKQTGSKMADPRGSSVTDFIPQILSSQDMRRVDRALEHFKTWQAAVNDLDDRRRLFVTNV